MIKHKMANYDSDCFRRLYNAGKDLEKKQLGKVQQRNKAYSFTPSLNSNSLKLANSLKRKPKDNFAESLS